MPFYTFTHECGGKGTVYGDEAHKLCINGPYYSKDFMNMLSHVSVMSLSSDCERPLNKIGEAPGPIKTLSSQFPCKSNAVKKVR